MNGYLSLVVAAHVPYLRHHGRDPIDEDPLHVTIAETLVPLMSVLLDLRDAGVQAPVGLACSPVLLEQLADPVVQKHFVLWMERWLDGVRANTARWEAEGQHHLLYLAQFYLDWGQTILDCFLVRLRRNTVVALRELCEASAIEPLLLPATNASLMDLGSESEVLAQIEVAMLNTARHLGQRPRGLVLRHGYRPQLEQILRAAGLAYVVAPPESVSAPGSGWLLSRRLAALTWDDAAEAQIYSRDLGYVGDPLYLASGTGIGASEPAYRRVGMGAALAGWYDPYHAFQRANEHAEHFVQFVSGVRAQADEPHPVVLATYNAGSGGQRWFESMVWLRRVLELADVQPELQLIAPGEYLRRHPPRRILEPIPSLSGRSAALKPFLSRAARRLAELAERLARPSPLQERILNQAARELLLAQDGAWAELDDEVQSGLVRPEQHLSIFEWLCDRAASPALSPAEAAELDLIEDRDSVFPLVNYRIFEDT